MRLEGAAFAVALASAVSQAAVAIDNATLFCADLTSADMREASMRRADLRGAQLGPLMIAEGRFVRTDFTRATLLTPNSSHERKH